MRKSHTCSDFVAQIEPRPKEGIVLQGGSDEPSGRRTSPATEIVIFCFSENLALNSHESSLYAFGVVTFKHNLLSGETCVQGIFWKLYGSCNFAPA